MCPTKAPLWKNSILQRRQKMVSLRKTIKGHRVRSSKKAYEHAKEHSNERERLRDLLLGMRPVIVVIGVEFLSFWSTGCDPAYAG